MRADAEQDLGRAGQKLRGGAVVEGDALPRPELSDKAAQLVGLRRAHPDCEIGARCAAPPGPERSSESATLPAVARR